MSDSVQSHRRQPTRLPHPWDSPGKNTGVGCHFLLQCMKVKSLSHVRPLATPRTAAYQAPPSMGFSRQEYWSGVPLPSPIHTYGTMYICVYIVCRYHPWQMRKLWKQLIVNSTFFFLAYCVVSGAIQMVFALYLYCLSIFPNSFYNVSPFI